MNGKRKLIKQNTNIVIEFILNDQKISTPVNGGVAMLDFIRKHQHLTGSKLVCKEGECGACSVLVGTLINGTIEYQSMTSCIMPIANAQGKHVVTIEGLNMTALTPIQQAMVNEYGTQCGFCTPGFVVSLSGYLLSKLPLTMEGIVGSIDGNICRCTGYKSIERAASIILEKVIQEAPDRKIERLCELGFLPTYFRTVTHKVTSLVQHEASSAGIKTVGGGTDLYVQKPIDMYKTDIHAVYDNSKMKEISIENGECSFGASMTMGDLYHSTEFNQVLPDSDYIFKLLSSTQIRNMATIGGNLINASPIGDFTVLLLALNSRITLKKKNHTRQIQLKDFYKSYKVIDLHEGELLDSIQFDIPSDKSVFHFEKVSQRKYFDIASVNVASQIEIENKQMTSSHFSIGGVGPIPTYLSKLSSFLAGKTLTKELIDEALDILQTEISPISDARGSESYKRTLARQLVLAQFLSIDPCIYSIKTLIAV